MVQKVGEYLELTEDKMLRCGKCGYIFCGAGENPKGHAVVKEKPLSAAGPRIAARWHGESPIFILREYYCPGCATMFELEETRRDRPGPWHSFKLKL